MMFRQFTELHWLSFTIRTGVWITFLISGTELVPVQNNINNNSSSDKLNNIVAVNNNNKTVTLASRRAPLPKPQWHPPWKLMRVISGHLGWVRCVDVDHTNDWFVTGSADRTIKIWDMASGTLKLSLTGHISTVRGVAVSDRHPYLFSCGEDKQVKCWDLEQNKVIITLHCTQILLCQGLFTVNYWDSLYLKSTVRNALWHSTYATLFCYLKNDAHFSAHNLPHTLTKTYLICQQQKSFYMYYGFVPLLRNYFETTPVKFYKTCIL